MEAEKFASYDELLKFKTEYEKSNFVPLVVKHSRSIEKAQQRAPDKVFEPRFKFAEVVYTCIHGGKNRPSSKGARPNQS